LFAVLTCIPSDDDQRVLLAEVRRALRPEGILYISDLLINSDVRNLERYERYANEYGVYGVFELPEGVIVRHHREEWIEQLTGAFASLAFEHLSVTTMNGNASAAFQYLPLCAWANNRNSLESRGMGSHSERRRRIPLSIGQPGIFVMKLNGDGSNMSYSTFITPQPFGFDAAPPVLSIAVDSGLRATVTQAPEQSERGPYASDTPQVISLTTLDPTGTKVLNYDTVTFVAGGPIAVTDEEGAPAGVAQNWIFFPGEILKGARAPRSG
jgi:hypothetical protein